MSGVKGRSGRRTLTDEIRMRELRNSVVVKAWKATDKLLDENCASKEKHGIAGNIVVKDMVSKESIDARQNITSHITIEEQNILNKYIERNRLQTN